MPTSEARRQAEVAAKQKRFEEALNGVYAAKPSQNVDDKTPAGVAETQKDKDKLGEKRPTVSGKSGKEKATDKPSWADGSGPRGTESGKDYANRVMNNKYGKDNWENNPDRQREFSQLKKFGDRNFVKPPKPEPPRNQNSSNDTSSQD